MGIQTTLYVTREEAIKIYFSRRERKCDLTNEELERSIEEHFHNYTIVEKEGTTLEDYYE